MKSRSREVVVILSWALGIGGVERKITDISQYISENTELSNRTVYLILDEKRPTDPDAGFFYDQVDDSIVRMLWKPWGPPGSIECPFSLYILWKVLSLRPTTILAFLRQLSVMAVALKYLLWWRKTKVIISDDTVTSLSLSDDVGNRFARYLESQLIQRFYAGADVVVCPTEAARRDLTDHFHIPSDIITVNKNWTLEHPDGNRHQHQFDLVYIGRVDPEKNLALLVEIIHEVRKTLPTVSACIVGSGNETGDVFRLAQEYGLDSTISFVGIQKDVGRYLLASRVLCLTSHYEGLPIAALEAMAHGLPVITTAYSGAEELVEDGRTGYVCATKKEYVDRVTYLLTNEKERVKMGRQAREYVTAHHGRENLRRFVGLLLGE